MGKWVVIALLAVVVTFGVFVVVVNPQVRCVVTFGDWIEAGMTYADGGLEPAPAYCYY